MNWIPTSERLPGDYRVPALVLVDGIPYIATYSILGNWSHYHKKMGGYIDGVTHWMPISDLPEGVK